MLSMLVFWNVTGDIVATQDFVVIQDDDGVPVGLMDFAAHEESGGRLRDIIEVSNATGAGTWPEWLSGAAHHFNVELDPVPGNARVKIKALVHKVSGHRRERAVIEAAISARIAEADGEPADIRDLVGGPDRPLLLDDEGKTKARVPLVRPDLPLIPVRPRGSPNG